MSSFSGLQKNPAKHKFKETLENYWPSFDEVFIMIDRSLMFDILTKAIGWGGCKISRVEKSCCQPKSKDHNWFIKCFPILLHTYHCNLNSYLWKGEWKKNSCVLIKQYVHMLDIILWCHNTLYIYSHLKHSF